MADMLKELEDNSYMTPQYQLPDIKDRVVMIFSLFNQLEMYRNLGIYNELYLQKANYDIADKAKDLIKDLIAENQQQDDLLKKLACDNHDAEFKIVELKAENQHYKEALERANEGIDLLSTIHGKYADLNLSFADNWYSNVEEFFANSDKLPPLKRNCHGD
jgi:phosphatidylinositol kinase/protein kinase (PI-3  family)